MLPDGLAWPPRKEDLERLYLVERLSAGNIAKFYGLKYKNAKVAESTVLYQLGKHGIRRRDPAEHIRKVTEEMVDEWTRRYQAGESLKQIAGELVNPVTVWNHLRRRGLILRDKVEAQIQAVTKYQREPFKGDLIERAYLIGLRYGDLDAVRHGRAIRVRLSTTHPAMADLFQSMFSPYGHVQWYPREAKLTGYEWTLECDLDASFEFLLHKAAISDLESLSEPEFIAFLAGLFDAEGSFHLHKKAHWYGPEAYISNKDAELLRVLTNRLRTLGLHTRLSWRKQRSDRSGIRGQSIVGRIEILRFFDAQRFARLIPIRHSEKVRRRELFESLEFGAAGKARLQTVAKWKELSNQIHDEVRSFIESAREKIGPESEIPVY